MSSSGSVQRTTRWWAVAIITAVASIAAVAAIATAPAQAMPCELSGLGCSEQSTGGGSGGTVWVPNESGGGEFQEEITVVGEAPEDSGYVPEPEPSPEPDDTGDHNAGPGPGGGGGEADESTPAAPPTGGDTEQSDGGNSTPATGSRECNERAAKYQADCQKRGELVCGFAGVAVAYIAKTPAGAAGGGWSAGAACSYVYKDVACVNDAESERQECEEDRREREGVVAPMPD